MDNPKTEKGQKAPQAEGSGDPRAEAGALFQTGPQLQGLADDWVALRRDAFLMSQRLIGLEARLIATEGRSTGDAHAKLNLLIQVLLHDLGLAPDHRAVLLTRGAVAALECVHRAVDPAAPVPGDP